MACEKNLLISTMHGLREMVRSALENVFTFFLSLIVLSAIAFFIHWSVDQLDRHTTPTVALAFVIVCAVVWLRFLSIITPASVRGTDGRIRSGVVFGFTAAAAMVWIYIFGVFSYLLLKLGAVAFVITKHPDAPLLDLLDAYLWYFLDLIPILKVNEALDWTADINLNGGWPGVILLLFRIVIVLQVFALAKRLLQARKQGLDDMG